MNCHNREVSINGGVSLSRGFSFGLISLDEKS